MTIMKAFIVKGYHDNYKAIPMDIVYDADGEIEYDSMFDSLEEGNKLAFLNDDQHTLYVLEYIHHGHDFSVYSSMEDIDEELEDIVVNDLKSKGNYREVEHSKRPWDIIDPCEYWLFKLEV